MSAVVDTPIKTKLTVEELQVRADTLLKRVGVTAAQIHHAAAYQKKTEDGVFIRVFLKGITDENMFANIYLNDDATASFTLSNKKTSQTLSEEQFVQCLSLLRTDRVKMSSSF